MSGTSNEFTADQKLRLEERRFDLKLKELEVQKRAVELPVELAKLGLRGTLIGAICGVILLIILAIIGACFEKAQINGTHLCVIMGIICLTVALYGAFVFDRSFRLAGRWQQNSLHIGIDDNPKKQTNA